VETGRYKGKEGRKEGERDRNGGRRNLIYKEETYLRSLEV
jgi:hypothetical protein